MKVLHTSDWHLGQKLMNLDRIEEHQAALDWLLELVNKEQVDILLVSGDIFHLANPSNQARQVYFNFLSAIKKTNCQHVVITGGNHDSPSFLNAPAGYLKSDQIHIVGDYSGDLMDEIITLKNKSGSVQAIIAAVPFLRDKDLRHSIAGETAEERSLGVQLGLVDHFNKAAELATKLATKDSPIIAMGHLFATGAKTGEHQERIYLGNIENISAQMFPSTFDYIALGHIHQAQPLGTSQIRYSGSLIPLNFSEHKGQKSVTLIEFNGKEIKSIKPIPVPVNRKLIRLVGSLPELLEGLKKIQKTGHFEDWVDLTFKDESTLAEIEHHLASLGEALPLKILSIRDGRKKESATFEESETLDLERLEDIDWVFEELLKHHQCDEEKTQTLKNTFEELLQWKKDQEREKQN